MAMGAGIRLSFQGCGFSSSEAGRQDGKNPDQLEIVRLLPDNQFLSVIVLEVAHMIKLLQSPKTFKFLLNI